MARQKVHFICQNCGAVYTRWTGKCEACGEWNTVTEEADDNDSHGPGLSSQRLKGRAVELTSLAGSTQGFARMKSNIAELDRVTGGGFVRGSALLLGGEPGIGKSTLLTQTAAALAQQNYNVIYVSGEEAVDQIRLRAQRLGIADATVKLAAETNVENILATLQQAQSAADLVIIDSIQTLWSSLAESAPGTVTQVRLGAQALIRFAKKTGSAVILVGHVTKDGQIAGPRVVEHMVDGVLYFEGDSGHHYRMLRTVKNRFGPTDEIGVFTMSNQGLSEVKNPSELFLGERKENAPGAAVFAGMEGTRPVLVEIQALVAPSTLGMARRAVVGWDANRLSMILAVLEARCGVRFASYDVYLNVAGGFRITEPAADLAVAAALISSMVSAALAPQTVFFGEISLSGAIRPVSHPNLRMKEAEKLGFTRAVFSSLTKDQHHFHNFTHDCYTDLAELVAKIAATGQKPHVQQKNS